MLAKPTLLLPCREEFWPAKEDPIHALSSWQTAKGKHASTRFWKEWRCITDHCG